MSRDGELGRYLRDGAARNAAPLLRLPDQLTTEKHGARLCVGFGGSVKLYKLDAVGSVPALRARSNFVSTLLSSPYPMLAR